MTWDVLNRGDTEVVTLVKNMYVKRRRVRGRAKKEVVICDRE